MILAADHSTERCDDAQARGLACYCLCAYCYTDPIRQSLERDIYTHTPPTTEETTTMSDTDIRSAEAAIRRAEEALELAKADLERARRTDPPEPAAGSVIKFSARYHAGGRIYTFAAVRTQVGWAVTGRDAQMRDWSGLLAWMRETFTWVGEIRVYSTAIETLTLDVS